MSIFTTTSTSSGFSFTPVQSPLTLVSFGFKHIGGLGDASVTIDCRILKNPHNVPELKALTGRDQRVKDFIANDPAFPALLAEATPYCRPGRVIAFGCYGGIHRSVAVAEMLFHQLAKQGLGIPLRCSHITLNHQHEMI